MNAAGKKPSLYEAYTAGEQDYTALVSKLKDDRHRRRLCRRLSHRSRPHHRQMREQGMDAVLMSGDALVTDEYLGRSPATPAQAR